MTPLRDRVRDHVGKYPGLTATEIARALRVPPATARKALLRMGERGEVAGELGPRTREDSRPCTRWRPAAGLTAGWLT